MDCVYCMKPATDHYMEELLCERHFNLLAPDSKKVIYLSGVFKENIEIKLNRKYTKLMEKCITKEDFDSLLPGFFKEITKAKIPLYSKVTVFILFFTLNSFSQEGIVVAGGSGNNVEYTIGAGLVELQIPVVAEVSLGVPIFEFPTSPKKPIVKKKSFIESILEFFKTLINKKKKP